MTVTVVRPPIPVTLAHRPVQGGLVVPWINLKLADGAYDFRAPHRAKVERCWTERRCQICGERIVGVLVLFGGPNQIDTMTFDESPMHPVCATYASKACPMVAGRLATYAATPSVSQGRRGKTCPDPGCDCGGWVPSPGETPGANTGAPAHSYWSVWADDYVLAVRPDGTLHGGQLVGQPRRVRHVSDPPAACPAGAS